MGRARNPETISNHSDRVMKTIFSRLGWARVAGYCLLVGLLTLRVLDPIPVKRLRLTVFDLFQQISPREPGQFPVTVPGSRGSAGLLDCRINHHLANADQHTETVRNGS